MAKRFTLRKAHIFVLGYLAIGGVIVGGFLIANVDVVQGGITALVWLLGLGLGAQVGDSLQRSAFYRPELREEIPPLSTAPITQEDHYGQGGA